MSDPKYINVGRSKLSEKVYFIDGSGNKIRPIYQKDRDTGICSYRVYIKGGNTKDNDKDVQCSKELGQLLAMGHSVRCKLPNRKSSNRKLDSKDIKRLVIEDKK